MESNHRDGLVGHKKYTVIKVWSTDFDVYCGHTRCNLSKIQISFFSTASHFITLHVCINPTRF